MFEIDNTLSFNTEKLVDGNEYDYVTRTSLNQGVLQSTGFINKEKINKAGTWSLGLLQMDFFYRQKPWYAGQFVRKITPKIEMTPSAILFFSALLNKQKKKLLSVLVRYVDETFKALKISLPLDESGKINFSFMEKFIAELEAYLSVTGLKNYELTEKEQKALKEYENVHWSKFRMGRLFERISTKRLPFKADDLPKQTTDKYTLPCLTSSFRNQGLNYFAPRADATILKNVVSLPSNSDVYRAYYQSNEFTVLSDAYAIRWTYDDMQLLPSQYLYAVACINKVTDLPIYSYKNKLEDGM